MIKQFIHDVREEKEGFSFDQPWRLEENSLGVVVPILRKKEAEREYVTLSEAEDVKVEDTGQIDYVYVKNNMDKPLLICRGEIFRGKTQERAAIHDHLVMPNKGLRVAVRCVHQTKGIQTGTEMKQKGRTGYSIDLSSQTDTWNSVATYSTNYRHVVSGSHNVGIGQTNPDTPLRVRGTGGTVCAGSPAMHPGESADSVVMNVASCVISEEPPTFHRSDDLVSTLDNMSESIREAMKKIPYIENQVGAAFFKENTLLGLDVYDLPDSWKAVKEEVVEKEGASFLEKDKDDMFQFSPEKAAKMLSKKLDIEFEEKIIFDQEYTLVELRSETLLGEAIIFKGNVIHLTLWKK